MYLTLLSWPGRILMIWNWQEPTEIFGFHQGLSKTFVSSCFRGTVLADLGMRLQNKCYQKNGCSAREDCRTAASPALTSFSFLSVVSSLSFSPRTWTYCPFSLSSIIFFLILPWIVPKVCVYQVLCCKRWKPYLKWFKGNLLAHTTWKSI